MLPIAEDVEGQRRWPVVTVGLIAVMTLLGLAMGPGREQTAQALVAQFGLVPSRLAADPVLEWPGLFTYVFLHGGFVHLATNMLFLWVFGRGLERELRWGYLPFFLIAGAAAGLGSIYWRWGATNPTIGASGAISGLLGAYLVLLPHANIRAIVLLPWAFLGAVLRGDRPVWDVPAWAAILTWFGLQIVESIGPAAAQSNVDYGAHIGGFLAGYLMIRLARGLFGWWPDEPAYQRLLDRPIGQGARLPHSYVRARRLIQPGMPIEPEDLECVDRGRRYVDPGAIPGRDGARLVGRRLREMKYRFEPFHWDELVPIDEGERASAPRHA